MMLMTSGVWKMLNFLLFSTFTMLETDGNPRPDSAAPDAIIGERVDAGGDVLQAARRRAVSGDRCRQAQ